MQSLNHKEAASLIAAIGARRTVVLEGENGIGKTALFDALQKLYPQHTPVMIDAQQLSDGSLWMPDIDRAAGVSRELPNERFGISPTNHRDSAEQTPVLICIDEVLKAKPYIQMQLAPLLYERRLGNRYLPHGSIVFGTTNLGIEGLGDMQQAHMRTRIVFVRLRKPSQQEWKRDFALPAGLNPILITYTDLYPHVFESFLDYEKGGEREGEKINPCIYNPHNYTGEAYVSPRTLQFASDIFDASDTLDHGTLEAALIGACGRPAARDMMTTYRFNLNLPAPALILQDPLGTPVPSDTASQIMQVNQLVARAKSRQEKENACVYVARLEGEPQLLFTRAVQALASRLADWLTIKAFQQFQADMKKYANV